MKLLIVFTIPLLWIALWVFSLFKLLSPADISWDINGSGAIENTWKVIVDQKQTSGNMVVWVATWNVSSWTITKAKIPKTLIVAMPIWLFNEPWRRPIINKLNQQSITLQIITNTWNQPYNNFVSDLLSGGATGADLILLNHDQLDVYGKYAGSFGFSQDISGLFPYVFFDYLKRTDFTFFPFAIDPLVTFAKKPLDGNTQTLDWSDIVNGITTSTEEDTRKLAVQIPILFGISSLDIQLIKNKKEAFIGYTDILKNILFQSSNRSELIDMIKQFSDERLEEYKLWDYAKYRRIADKLIERNPKCEHYPQLCFMYYKLTSFSFWYLSDLDVLNNYFEKSDYTVYNFPNSSSVYPVRLRWWVVNKAKYDSLVKVDSEGVSKAWVFFQEYIAQSTNGNHYLWPTLFSAFNVVLQNQESDLQWKYVAQYKNKRQVNPIKLDTDQKREQVLALIRWEYDIRVFLAGLVR